MVGAHDATLRPTMLLVIVPAVIILEQSSFWKSDPSGTVMALEIM